MSTHIKAGTYLERVFAREALVAMVAREWLDCEMDPLMPFEVMISVETLRTLIALEWPIVCRWLLVLRMSHKVWHGSCVTTVEAGHHTRVHTNERKLTVRILYVREHRGWA